MNTQDKENLVPLLTLGRYFKQKFGVRVRKIPITLLGFTCPNIDGTLAKGGCIYCDNESFSPSFVKVANLKAPIFMNLKLESNPILNKQLEQLESQFHWHADFHKDKFGIAKYMVYFQSYSNTYAPFDTLKALYSKALGLANVVGLSIGTRIDCIEDRLLDFLGEQVKNGFEIWIEYGIQSTNEETLKAINRAHGIKGAKELFIKTREKGIKVCAHLMYGLPNETNEMMLDSLKNTLEFGVDGLKLHPLYVIKGTKLAKMFNSGAYIPIDLDTYVELVVDSIKMIPKDVVLHRISSGAHLDSLIAPKWCFDKNIQMRLLREKLKEIGVDY